VNFWQTLIAITVSVLIPAIPAFVLYKWLPSTAEVSGPFQGLQLKLGGAFAGYFIVFMAVIAFWKLQSNYEVWKVSGWTNFEDDPGRDKTGVLISVVPSAKIQADGSFEINVLKQMDVDGAMNFPMLVLEQPTEDKRYTPAVVHLNDNAPNFPGSHKKTVSKWYQWSRHISIDDAVIITRTTTGPSNYMGNKPAPTPDAAAPTPPAPTKAQTP
jgi:hypothetical protein